MSVVYVVQIVSCARYHFIIAGVLQRQLFTRVCRYVDIIGSLVPVISDILLGSNYLSKFLLYLPHALVVVVISGDSESSLY
jgi:hypothetical protein